MIYIYPRWKIADDPSWALDTYRNELMLDLPLAMPFPPFFLVINA